MSAKVKGEQQAPRHRRRLPRIRIRKHYDFRPEVYVLLARLRHVDGQLRVESETEAIERLILEATAQLPAASKRIGGYA